MRSLVLAAVLAAACAGSALADQKHGPGPTPVRRICIVHPRRGPPPPNATAQCRDGTWSFSRHRSGTCSRHGGVAAWR